MAIAADAHKKLARIMVDRKIPSALRDRIVLPAAGREILWVPGGPVHREYRITEETKTVLELTLHRDVAVQEEQDSFRGRGQSASPEQK